MIDQEKFAEVSQKLKPMLLLCLIAFVGTFVVVKLTKVGNKDKAQDFFSASQAFDAWDALPNEENWQLLKQNLDQHTELYPKFKGYIAQRFIYEEKECPDFLQTKLAPTSPYLYFSKAGEALKVKNYTEALTAALKLKEDLSSRKSSFATLYGFNLIQIASLQKELGLAADEQNSWKEFQEFFETSKDENSLKLIAAHFQKGNISLQKYIEYRLARD